MRLLYSSPLHGSCCGSGWGAAGRGRRFIGCVEAIDALSCAPTELRVRMDDLVAFRLACCAPEGLPSAGRFVPRFACAAAAPAASVFLRDDLEFAPRAAAAACDALVLDARDFLVE